MDIREKQFVTAPRQPAVHFIKLPAPGCFTDEPALKWSLHTACNYRPVSAVSARQPTRLLAS